MELVREVHERAAQHAKQQEEAQHALVAAKHIEAIALADAKAKEHKKALHDDRIQNDYHERNAARLLVEANHKTVLQR
jgi:hypothetical protein